jgi:hypothetical protein
MVMNRRSGEHTMRRRPFPSTWIAAGRKYALPAALMSILGLAIVPLVGPHLLHALQEVISALGA